VLVDATPEQLWGGAAVTRPSPGGLQLKAESTSAEDDLQKADIADVWDVTVGAVVSAADVARITVNGIHYDYMVAMGDTDAMVALGLSQAVSLGSKATHTLAPGGGMDLGDTYRITIAANTYDHVCGAADTPAIVVAGLLAAVNAGAGDPLYTAINAGSFLVLQAKARGVTATPTASLPVDTNADATFALTTLVAGVVADTNYTTGVLAATVKLTNVLAGVTSDTVASTFAVDPGLDSTCTAVHTTTGAAGAAGTGIRSLLLEYLDSAGAVQSEAISMNGTTAVATVATDIVEILQLSATAVGSAGAAVGTITLKNMAGATTYEQLAVGTCETRSAIYKVPASKRAFVIGMELSASVASAFALCSDCNPQTGAVVSGAKFVWSLDQAGAQGHNDNLSDTPIGPFPAGARFWLEATGGAGRTVFGSVSFYLETVV
jgi:hypothetical protein